ncbi:MAG: hypothetical protein PQ975_05600 [Methanobacterium sp.]
MKSLPSMTRETSNGIFGKYWGSTDHAAGCNLKEAIQHLQMEVLK